MDIIELFKPLRSNGRCKNLSLGNTNGGGEAGDEVEELLDGASDGVEGGRNVNETSQGLDIGQQTLNEGHGAGDLARDCVKTSREVSLSKHALDELNDTLELGLDSGQGTLDVSDCTVQDALNEGVDVADSTSDGGEEAGDNREEAAGGVKNSAQETSNVKTELTLLNES